ncbi:uncharacterized protein LOC135385393 [Ornithodoros turicata]|uniref:uncharacterized protein LOC135385393 n=1 Tax=Ornithodoros turicata TaxID=34597 RepID=UPI00313974C3
MLLYIAGDVELNPGPTLEEMIADIRQGQLRKDAVLESIRENQKDIDLRLANIETKVTVIDNIQSSIVSHEEVIAELKSQIADMTHKLDDLENRSRRNNLIIRGLPEAPGPFEDTRQLLHDTVFKSLGVTVSTIERAHRIGAKKPEHNRPVILRLYDYNEKVSILKNSRKLKGTSITVSEDFSFAVRQVRKKLWDSAGDSRLKGEKVRLVYDKLRINNCVYKWDERSQSRVYFTADTVNPVQNLQGTNNLTQNTDNTRTLRSRTKVIRPISK